jgi:hypothetical protein
MKPRKYGWADKAAPYKSWRYQWNVSGVHDVDQIEWRGDYPVAVLELTTNPIINQAVKDRVAHRLWYQFSGKKLRHVAKALGVPFYRHWLSSLQPLRSTKDTNAAKATNSQ